MRRRNNRLMTLILRFWNGAGADSIDAALDVVIPQVLTVTMRVQEATAADALELTPTIMETLDESTHMRRLIPESAATYVGWAGDGQPLEVTLREAASKAGNDALQQGLQMGEARRRALESLQRTVRTATADTQRDASVVASQSVSATARPVRVLNPPSCARCILLAGTSGNAFERHPNCDCTVVWSEDVPDGCYAHPTEYLESLSDEQLVKVLGSKANAQAWKDGADLAQLVNAYRRKGGVSTQQYLGRKVRATVEGTGRGGFATRRMVQSGLGSMDRKPGSRAYKLDSPRLMPSSIYQIAAETGRDPRTILYQYGWIK